MAAFSMPAVANRVPPPYTAMAPVAWSMTPTPTVPAWPARTGARAAASRRSHVRRLRAAAGPLAGHPVAVTRWAPSRPAAGVAAGGRVTGRRRPSDEMATTAMNAAMSAKASTKESRSQRARPPAWAGRAGAAGRMRPGGPMRRRWLTKRSRASIYPPNAHEDARAQLRGYTIPLKPHTGASDVMRAGKSLFPRI